MEERKENCGGCDYQGDVTQKEVECLVDGKWHKKGEDDWCLRWKRYVSGKNKEDRREMALEKRREERAEATKIEDRKFKEELLQNQQDFETNQQKIQQDFETKQQEKQNDFETKQQTKNQEFQRKLAWIAGLISLGVSLITNLIIHWL